MQSMNRRRALKQTFRFSAALLAGRTFLHAETITPSASGALHYLMIGDWGWLDDIQPQTAVARGMARYSENRKIKPEALFLLGDNFYGPFKGGTDCPRWKTQFEDMYPKEVFPGPCHVVLGNHDYDDAPDINPDAQLAYANAHPGTRWNLPAKWYRLELGPASKPLVTVLALDSNYHNKKVSLTPEEREKQLAWLNAELDKPRATPWLVVTGHHPLYSDGMHGDDKALIKDWDALFRKHKVHFYFCGHDHDLQHLEFEDHSTSFVITGGGGAKIREPKLKRGKFAKGVYGFTHLEVTAEKFIVRHLDPDRKVLHAFAKKPDGSWMAL
jgi:tartrate-resistant acid phosphatase type 5